MPNHVVRRPFDEGGRTLPTGTLVDASDWLNLPYLLAQGYLAEAPPADEAPPPRTRSRGVPKA